MLPVTDAVVLSTVADGVIVVAGAGLVERDHLSQSLDAIESVNGKVLGIVLNRIPRSDGDQYSRYSYTYSLPEEEVNRRDRRRASRDRPAERERLSRPAERERVPRAVPETRG